MVSEGVPGNWAAGVRLPPEMRGALNPREVTPGIYIIHRLLWILLHNFPW